MKNKIVWCYDGQWFKKLKSLLINHHKLFKHLPKILRFEEKIMVRIILDRNYATFHKFLLLSWLSFMWFDGVLFFAASFYLTNMAEICRQDRILKSFVLIQIKPNVKNSLTIWYYELIPSLCRVCANIRTC